MKTTAPDSFHYFQSDVQPQVGDRVATGSMGDCKVTAITQEWELEVLNLFTKETGHVFAADCDLVSPSPSVVPVEVPAHKTGKPWYVGASAPGHITVNVCSENGAIVAQNVFKGDAEDIVTACNSHAANLAKIKALEDASNALLAHLSMETPKKDLDSYADYTLESLNLQDALRAALALPSASPSLLES